MIVIRPRQITLAALASLSIFIAGSQTSSVAFAGLTAPNPTQKSEDLISKSCDLFVVADPTDTPLNVRDTPSKDGRMIGTYQNGDGVRLERYSDDGAWAYVTPQNRRANKTPGGWVWAAYLKCAS